MANVTGNGMGIVSSARGERPSLAELIKDLVRGADHALTEAKQSGEVPREGILLTGTKFRREVHRALIEAGYTAVFREGVDRKEYIPSRDKLYRIDLDECFKGY